MFSKLIAFVGDNSIQIDTAEGEAKLRQDDPRLLQDGEIVIMAFQDRGGIGRDSSFFTNRRVLKRNKKMITGQVVNYLSIPYKSIVAWSVDSAGALDADCTLRLWSEGVGYISFDYVAGQVDMFNILRHFNSMCLVEGNDGASTEVRAQATIPTPTPPTAVDTLLGFLGDDASQIDAKMVEGELKNNLKLLMPSETIEMAFKSGRDSFLITSKRILIVDVQGITGKKVEYRSVLWRQIRMFSIQSAGSFDTDAELILYTDIPTMPRINQDLRKGKADIMAIQKYFADKLLGTDHTPFSPHGVTMAGVADKGSGSIFAWLGDDSRMVDAAQLNYQYHMNPPILQGSEVVEMAFKGRRDLAMFTTKRLLLVDMKGWSGQKVMYLSVPWGNVQCFGVRSAGSWMDKDAEMMIWTDVNDVLPGTDNSPPHPRNSFLEIDFQKDKVDLMAIHRYLSERCLPVESGGILPPEVAVSEEVMKASPPSGVESFLNWIGDDARFIPASEVEQQLRGVNPMLQVNEHVGMAFKSGRDMIIFTTKRVLLVDVQGFTGKKVEWTSIPYGCVRCFSVRTAGSFDRDAEVSLLTKTYWTSSDPGSGWKQDLRKGKCDIFAMQSYLAAQILESQGGLALPPPLNAESQVTPKGADGLLEWLSGDAYEINATELDLKLHSAPQILQSDESVERAYKTGRDTMIYTTKRLLQIDVQGLTGQKVAYTSYPIAHCTGFAVQSPGMVSVVHSANATVFTSIPAVREISQDLSKSRANIWDVHAHLVPKLL